MQTKWLMTASAAFMAALGIAATFLPQEIAARYGGDPHGPAILLLQTTGGLYLGFAMLDWVAREMLLGGIYNRPIVIGNLVHFTVVALALAKAVATGRREIELVTMALFYALFAVGFGWAMFSSPTRDLPA